MMVRYRWTRPNKKGPWLGICNIGRWFQSTRLTGQSDKIINQYWQCVMRTITQTLWIFIYILLSSSISYIQWYTRLYVNFFFHWRHIHPVDIDYRKKPWAPSVRTETPLPSKDEKTCTCKSELRSNVIIRSITCTS